MDSKDVNLKAIEKQLGKSTAMWVKIGKVIKNKSEYNLKILSILYEVRVLTMLLCGSASWVLNNI